VSNATMLSLDDLPESAQSTPWQFRACTSVQFRSRSLEHSMVRVLQQILKSATGQSQAKRSLEYSIQPQNARGQLFSPPRRFKDRPWTVDPKTHLTLGANLD